MVQIITGCNCGHVAVDQTWANRRKLHVLTRDWNEPKWTLLTDFVGGKGTEHSLLHYWRVSRRTGDREGGRDRARGLGYNNEASCNLNVPRTTRQSDRLLSGKKWLGDSPCSAPAISSVDYLNGHPHSIILLAKMSLRKEAAEKGGHARHEQLGWVGHRPRVTCHGQAALLPVARSPVNVFPYKSQHSNKGRALSLSSKHLCFWINPIKVTNMATGHWPAHYQNKFCDRIRNENL